MSVNGEKLFVNKPWGNFEQFTHNQHTTVKILTLRPNSRISLQYHKNRSEKWIVLDGEGVAEVGISPYDLENTKGTHKINLKAGAEAIIPQGHIHRLASGNSTLRVLEISYGDFDEKDLIRLQDDYGRGNNENEVIVAASGGFDPLHAGHIEYLKMAKSLGDKLVVILNKDNFLKEKKGYSFMPLERRMEIIKSLKFVDSVIPCIDDDRTVCKTLEMLKPNIFAKGGDRFAHEIPEAEVCNRLGIKIIDGLGMKIDSSSELVNKIKTG